MIIETKGQNLLLQSFQINNQLECTMKCSNNFLCSIAIIDISICKIYSKTFNKSNSIYSLTANLYIKRGYNSINDYLIHYWPFNGNYMNEITKVYLFNGQNDKLVTDRFGRPSSSLYLNDGYLQAPNGTYINGDFTLTTWVKMKTLVEYRRFFVLKSTNGYTAYFSLTRVFGSGPYLYYPTTEFNANAPLVIEKWQHLAFTIKGSILAIYIDGICVYNGTGNAINTPISTDVYFGSYYEPTLRPNAEFDDFKLFSKSLTREEIIQSSLDFF